MTYKIEIDPEAADAFFDSYFDSYLRQELTWAENTMPTFNHPEDLTWQKDYIEALKALIKCRS